MPHVSVHPLLLRRWMFAAALTVALLAGGGGAEAPLQNGLIAAFGVFLLLFVVVDHVAGHQHLPQHAWVPALLAIALLLIPMWQLVPLPPGVWQTLPGREYAVNAVREAGAPKTWHSLSLDPDATKRSAAAMLLPIALFLHTMRSSHANNLFLVKVVVGCAAIGGLVGALQLAAGHPDWLAFHDGPSVGAASGFFANPNHQSLLMVCAAVACAILIRSDRPPTHRTRIQPRQLVLWALIFFFALMTLATGSRAGILLLALGLPGALLVALGSGSLLRWATAVVGVLALLWIIILLYPGTNSLAVRESFRLGADARYAYLPDILYTLDQYWSAGSGLGTFADIFAPNENLDFAQRGYLNHAHNDFLEWLIETGALGGTWLGLALIAFLFFGFKALFDNKSAPWLMAGGVIIILLSAVHSLVDYPLRTATMASVVAIALGLLPSAVKRPAPASAGGVKLAHVLVGLLLALPLSAEALRISIVQWAARNDKEQIALTVGPSNARVLAKQSDAAMRAGNPRLAEQFATSAIVAQPMNSAALRTLAMSREAQQQPANSTWRVASSLGWRDPPTQLWAFRQALVDQEYEIAAIRADALLRTSNPPPAFIQLVRLAARNPRFVSSLAGRLRLNPRWRDQYFRVDDKSSQAELDALVATLREMAKSGDAPTRSDGRSLIAHSIKRKAFDQAILVDRLVAGDRATRDNLLDDGGFSRIAEDYATNATPFDWTLHKGQHAAGSIDASPPSYLVADTDGERSQPAAERFLKLLPGSYRLSYRVRSDASDAFVVRIACVDRTTPVASDLIPSSQSLTQRTLDFAVNPTCLLTRLVVESMPVGTAATAEFDDFQMVPHEPFTSAATTMHPSVATRTEI